MFGKKEYLGIAIQDGSIRVARLQVSGNDISLIKLDQFSLVEEIKTTVHSQELAGENGSSFDELEEDNDTDAIFGFDEEEEHEEEDLDFGDLDDLEDEGEDLGMDMVDEADTPQSNELLFYNILMGLESDKVDLGLNIPAGSTIFQVIRDTDFNEVKKKDLIEDLESKLQSIYGEPKSSDHYSYEIREDGSLLLASVENESVTLNLVNQARELYNGKLTVQNVIPDEIGLVGLIRDSYDLQPDEVTCAIQFGKTQCRVVFMKGEEVWLVSPIVNEGTSSSSFLNTLFSKILFQLDTGEVPSLDRILLANNSEGNAAVEFFKDNFPDIHVENLSISEEYYEAENIDPSSIPAFTTAIGTALAASGARTECFPNFSFVPQYVEDRQKLFKLQWHGMLILVLIFLTPITVNYFYNQNVQQIESLSSELNQMNSQIENLTPIVNKSNELSDDLGTLKEKLVLLDTLTQGSQEWSAKFRILNEGIQDVGNSWITSFSNESSGISLRGYTLYRNRVPQIVNIFENATLMSVNNEELREQQLYSFSILVKEFTADKSLYSPSTPEEVEKLIEE